MKWLRARTAVHALALIGVLTVGLVLARVGSGQDVSVAPVEAARSLDRNGERARDIYTTIEQDFRTEQDLFVEVYPSPADAYATLWPLTQMIAGDLVVSRLLGPRPAPGSLAAFETYWDATASPPGYSASMQPPLSSGDRKFFDDNAWTGLALVQEYRLSGNQAALARARQVFDFTVSGWDSDPSHPDQGGVWWSQQMPNPRFAHRNAVSTASSAELGLQLYQASGRTEAYEMDWATRMYDWVDAYLRGTNGLYGDHVDLAGVVDPGQLTYNQGTMIGASVLLYRVRQDPAYLARGRAIADTSLQVFGPDFSQQPAYNAVFFRNLLLLESETGDERYRAAMQAYADQVWDTLRDPATGLFNFAYGRSRSIEPHRLVDQAAMLQIYALLALGPSAADSIT